jgi:hypothetical protein
VHVSHGVVPYCPLFSAVCNATIPTLPLFEMLRFTLSLVYKVYKGYIGFLSRNHHLLCRNPPTDGLMLIFERRAIACN